MENMKNTELYRMYGATRAVRSLAVRGLPWALLNEPSAAVLMLRTWWCLRPVERILHRKVLSVAVEEEEEEVRDA
jgi:hypothetical protein